MLRRVTPAAAVLGSVCVAGLACADDQRLSSLSWVELPGAESCGGAPAIARAVEQRLGREALVSPAAATFSIEGRAERSGAGLRAVLVLRDHTGAQLGERELSSEGPDCNELREKVSLAVALMIDPDAAIRSPPQAPQATVAPSVSRADAAPSTSSSPVPVQAAVPQHAQLPTDLATPSRSPKERREAIDVSPPGRWSVEPAVSAAIGFGFMPSASVGAILDTTLLPPRFWPMKFYAGGWASQTPAASASASAHFTSAFGGIGLCPLLERSGAFSLLVCGAGQLGIANAEPEGFEAAHGGSLLTFHLVPDAHLSIQLARGISARAGGSLAVALLRSQFVFETSAGQRFLFDPPWLAGTVDLGLAVTLP